jgi:glycosyltransferase involved in cell wall biosynthesis
MNNNKILMIVNEFPPSAESGVQRPLKFLKYLSKDNWQTFIITPNQPVRRKNQDLSTKLFKTSSLGICEDNLTEIRSDLAETTNLLKKSIWKAVKLINDILFPLDKQIGWVPFAVISAIKVINKYKIRNLYITAFPFSAFLCGVILKKLYGKKLFWVADYRDAWQFAPILKKMVLPFRYKFICRMDEVFLRKADYVLFTSPFVLELYSKKYNWLTPKAEVITNGYDEDDFVNVKPKQFAKFTFLYMGRIFTLKRNPIPLLQSIGQYMKSDYQYLHIGSIGKSMLNLIESKGLDAFQFLGYKTHSEAIEYSAGADVNVMINNNDPDSEGVVPGKLFELLRIGKPILVVGPHQTFIQELLSKTKAGVYVDSENTEDIIRVLISLMSKDFTPGINIEEIQQYSRKALTERLESIYLRG